MDLDSDTVQDSFSTARQSSFQNQIKAEEETLQVRLTSIQVSYWSPISYKQFKIHFAQRHSSVSKTVFTLLSLFFGDSRFIQHSKTVQFPKSDQGWGRDITGEADSITGQLLVTYLLHTVQDPFWTATQFSFENSFHTPLCFLVDQVLAHRSRLRKRLYGWGWLQSRSAVSHPSLIHSSRSIQRSKTVQFPKQFSLSSLCFLVDQVLASQIKAEEETLWVKLTPKQISC